MAMEMRNLARRKVSHPGAGSQQFPEELQVLPSLPRASLLAAPPPEAQQGCVDFPGVLQAQPPGQPLHSAAARSEQQRRARWRPPTLPYAPSRRGRSPDPRRQKMQSWSCGPSEATRLPMRIRPFCALAAPPASPTAPCTGSCCSGSARSRAAVPEVWQAEQRHPCRVPRRHQQRLCPIVCPHPRAAALRQIAVPVPTPPAPRQPDLSDNWLRAEPPHQLHLRPPHWSQQPSL
mmetsp:Transcript_103702/g.199070  ORF Transcript_103702/g.199070 Transcript_103702/m.199070 type:complete len:233 (-) Transcript_103702:313-1011(-)